MINTDTLIKICRNRGYKIDWPEQVNKMKLRLNEIKLGFPGIRNDHLSLIEIKDLIPGDIFIYDNFIESDRIRDDAPIMLRFLENKNCYIEGIGCGLDSIRDPKRTLFKWKDEVSFPLVPYNFLVYRVDVRPTENGGPGYYYFFKSYRDFRY